MNLRVARESKHEGPINQPRGLKAALVARNSESLISDEIDIGLHALLRILCPRVSLAAPSLLSRTLLFSFLSFARSRPRKQRARSPFILGLQPRRKQVSLRIFGIECPILGRCLRLSPRGSHTPGHITNIMPVLLCSRCNEFYRFLSLQFRIPFCSSVVICHIKFLHTHITIIILFTL